MITKLHLTLIVCSSLFVERVHGSVHVAISFRASASGLAALEKQKVGEMARHDFEQELAKNKIVQTATEMQVHDYERALLQSTGLKFSCSRRTALACACTARDVDEHGASEAFSFGYANRFAALEKSGGRIRRSQTAGEDGTGDETGDGEEAVKEEKQGRWQRTETERDAVKSFCVKPLDTKPARMRLPSTPRPVQQ